MEKSKYIVVDDPMWGYQIYVFPLTVDHAAFAQCLNFKKENILGAGFVRSNPTTNTLYCGGESLSLKIKSRDEDTKLLSRILK